MHRNKHADEISRRFRQLVEEAGDSLPDAHYDELALLIEAGIDTALLEQLEKMAAKLEALTASLRTDADFFN